MQRNATQNILSSLLYALVDCIFCCSGSHDTSTLVAAQGLPVFSDSMRVWIHVGLAVTPEYIFSGNSFPM